MIRWRGLLGWAILGVLGFAFSFLTVDLWVEMLLEKGGQMITGAKVEIDGLDIDPWNLSVEWNRFQAANPRSTWENAVETGRAAFRMNLHALLRKKVVIQEMALESVRWGTPRETDGAIKQPDRRDSDDKPGVIRRVQNTLERKLEQLPVLGWDQETWKQKVRVDSLVVAADLNSPERMDSLKTVMESWKSKWGRFYADFQAEERLSDIEKRIQQIRETDMKTLPGLLQAYDGLSEVQSQLNRFSDSLKNRSSSLQEEILRLENSVARIPEWIEEDYQKVLHKAKLPVFSRENVALALFGPMTVKRINKSLEIFRIGRRILKSSGPPTPRKPRMRGEIVHFPDKNRWPSFLIEDMHLSLMTRDSTGINGRITGIASQPVVYGRPLKAVLSGTKKDGSALLLEAVMDHTSSAENDVVSMDLSGIPVSEVPVYPGGSGGFMISRARARFAGRASVSAGLFGLNAEMDLSGIGWNLPAVNQGEVVPVILKKVLENTRILKIQAEVTETGEGFIFSMSSNVDGEISRALSEAAGEALTEVRDRIREQIQIRVSAKQENVYRFWGAWREETETPMSTVTNQLASIQDRLQQTVKKIAGEILKKQEQETKDLGERAQDLLNRLLEQKK